MELMGAECGIWAHKGIRHFQGIHMRWACVDQQPLQGGGSRYVGLEAGIDWHINALWDVQMNGQFKVDGSGNVELKEEDGIDYAAVTVQMPGGERVPFLFTVKELNAKGTPRRFRRRLRCPLVPRLHLP